MARRDRIALALVLSALAGFLLALALPAHAADCPPGLIPPAVSIPPAVGSALLAGASGFAAYREFRRRRRIVGVFTIGLGAFGIATLVSAFAFAQESAAPAPDGAAFVLLPGVAWHAQPLFLALCGALISMGIGALKRSAAGAWLDKSALRDIAAVLTASVVAALPHLAAGLAPFGYAVLGHIIAATMAWAAANGAAKVARERKTRAIDDAAAKL